LKEIHLAIAFDQNYLKPFYALITSVFLNNPNRRFVVHSIISGISQQEIDRISFFCKKYNSEFRTYSIDFNQTNKFVLTNKWTPAVYYRLYFPSLVDQDIDRLLYLDTDIIVLNDLWTLFESDLCGKPVGAVYDNYVQNQEDIGIYGEGNYFNSGVLLIDLKLWREQEISEKAIVFLGKYPEKIKFVDQDALNAVLVNNWCSLDWKYNVIYSRLPQGVGIKELEKFIQDKVIIHFTLQRPWFKLCKNRLRFLYRKYLLLSDSTDKEVFFTDPNFTTQAYIKIRLLEFYFDNQFISKIWRGLKSLLKFH
jgi:lipopolysaccharide biosynthesis glycosyltransferase